ncbi:MAG TPA: 5-methyltetrahydropteroyltriglutamate--homocysteine S-methyltransferase, partial [Thermomicrobiales bacterium]|nr:5-methyltetrahydropteroyltriglutamate--homocysteine S-methyltransferase [Thermomicrobiales bacterium]
MVRSTIAGFPRFGPNRELKWALEGFWSGKRTEADLLQTAASLRLANWTLQQQAGLDLIPVNDFSLYDQVLDTSALFGAVPERYGTVSGQVSLDQYFAMARGRANVDPVTALDMTKWFDTNYHYLVPELHAGQSFALTGTKPIAELTEATSAGLAARPVIIGPLTYLALSHTTDGSDPLKLLEALLPQYTALVQKLIGAGATIIQFDEPILATGRFDTDQSALTRTYEPIAAAAGTAETWVVVPYGDPGATWDALVNLPVSGIGLDLTRDLTVDDIVRRGFPAAKVLIAGIVDGRNIWTNDLDASLSQLETLSEIVGPDQIVVSTSCSLLHVPYDVTLEPDLDPATQSWFAFARQKVDEVVTLTRGLATGRDSIAQEIVTSTAICGEMKKSPQRNVASVRSRVRTIDPTADQRPVPFAQRRTIQADTLKLPDLPTTTIGSFPQTPALRSARRKFDKGEIDLATYDAAIEESIRETIAEQEAIGLDVLVHGEPERNDMVQYFGEQLEGFVFTHNGWVQSYGSRMVRPPIILGDVSRPHP